MTSSGTHVGGLSKLEEGGGGGGGERAQFFPIQTDLHR